MPFLAGILKSPEDRELTMKINRPRLIISTLILLTLFFSKGCSEPVEEIERPEEVMSKRVVIYDHETYSRLADAWKAYHRAYPSEESYANWMYAARYAGRENYEELLEKGLERYPANPTLLYLAGILRHGRADTEGGLRYLERAARLDPSYLDPWFSLVTHYMERDDEEQMDVALRKLLEGSAVSEEVMDYCYNMLASLDERAVLITNGDNDTYPVWILQRILGYRTDVRIVNRSLLSTTWYPSHVIEEGVPRFITAGELDDLRSSMKGPYGDTLIVRIIQAAVREERPVCLSLTLYPSEVVDRYAETGRMLGLVTLVTPPERPYGEQLEEAVHVITNEYRTGGLDSWKVRYGKRGDAGRMLMMNYAGNIQRLIDPLREFAPGGLLPLFEWYREHCVPAIPRKMADETGEKWCEVEGVPEIRAWCRTEGYGY